LKDPLQRYTVGTIQRAAGDSVGDSAAIHRTAGKGLGGASSSLPHLDTIQRSFGGHDVTHVQAHTGSAAANANKAMGSEAYATGDHVAFKYSSPSLHTTAHEAAHIVQQRAGVSLKGGVGQVGDKYERHADAVADAVVQGRSAEGILGQMAGGSRGMNSGQSAQFEGGQPGKGSYLSYPRLSSAVPSVQLQRAPLQFGRLPQDTEAGFMTHQFEPDETASGPQAGVGIEYSNDDGFAGSGAAGHIWKPSWGKYEGAFDMGPLPGTGIPWKIVYKGELKVVPIQEKVSLSAKGLSAKMSAEASLSGELAANFSALPLGAPSFASDLSTFISGGMELKAVGEMVHFKKEYKGQAALFGKVEVGVQGKLPELFGGSEFKRILLSGQQELANFKKVEFCDGRLKQPEGFKLGPLPQSIHNTCMGWYQTNASAPAAVELGEVVTTMPKAGSSVVVSQGAAYRLTGVRENLVAEVLSGTATAATVKMTTAQGNFTRDFDFADHEIYHKKTDPQTWSQWATGWW
jgi:hypothetical protein